MKQNLKLNLETIFNCGTDRILMDQFLLILWVYNYSPTNKSHQQRIIKTFFFIIHTRLQQILEIGNIPMVTEYLRNRLEEFSQVNLPLYQSLFPIFIADITRAKKTSSYNNIIIINIWQIIHYVLQNSELFMEGLKVGREFVNSC